MPGASQPDSSPTEHGGHNPAPRGQSDLVALVVIAVLGVLAAVVTFGFLQSAAETYSPTYSLSGAFAAAAVSWILLSSIYFRLRRSSQFESVRQLTDELQILRRTTEERNEEIQQLQSKLLKITPHPPDFDVETDERQHLVLAKPRDWIHRGVVFDFQERPENRRENVFPRNFKVSYGQIWPPDQTPDGYYRWFLRQYFEDRMNELWLDGYTTELAFLGGPEDRVKCLKVISDHFAKVTFDNSQHYAQWEFINREAFEKSGGSRQSAASGGESDGDLGQSVTIEPAVSTQSAIDPGSHVTDPGPLPAKNVELPDVRKVSHSYLRFRRLMVVCYKEELGTIFFFEGTADPSDFPESSRVFNQVLDSVRFLI
jgi:hypothetical protein